jgi:hypothetical protein
MSQPLCVRAIHHSMEAILIHMAAHLRRQMSIMPISIGRKTILYELPQKIPHLRGNLQFPQLLPHSPITSRCRAAAFSVQVGSMGKRQPIRAADRENPRSLKVPSYDVRSLACRNLDFQDFLHIPRLKESSDLSLVPVVRPLSHQLRDTSEPSCPYASTWFKTWGARDPIISPNTDGLLISNSVNSATPQQFHSICYRTPSV